MRINDWAITDRPREKMMANGADSLSEVELLAILINTGQKGLSAVDLARNLFNRCHNSLIELAHTIMHNEEADNHNVLKGLGPAKICTIQAALELGRRKACEEEVARQNAVVINNSRTIFAQFNHQLSDLDHEELWAIYTSKNGKIVLKKKLSEGGSDFAGADIKKIAKYAIELLASNVVLCHNHPHSSTRPSKADREMTQKAKEALALFDIRLLDHIIISDGRYFSFVDNGEL